MRSTQKSSELLTITVTEIKNCKKKLDDYVREINGCLKNSETSQIGFQAVEHLIEKSLEFMITKPHLYALLLQHNLELADLKDNLQAFKYLPKGPRKWEYFDTCINKLNLSINILSDVLSAYSTQKNKSFIVLNYTGSSKKIEDIAAFYMDAFYKAHSQPMHTQSAHHPLGHSNNSNRFAFGERCSSQNKGTLAEHPDDASGINNDQRFSSKK